MTLFERNASVLPLELLRQLEDAGEPAAPLEIIETEEGAPTARYGGRFLHPQRGPRSRPARVFTAERVTAGPVVVFFGFGLGYEVEAFLSRPEAEAAIVVEPDAGLFRAALGIRDLTGVLASPKTTLLVEADPEELAMVLRRWERRRPERSVLNAAAQYHREYFDRVEAVMAAAADRARINSNTLKRFGRLWVRNLIRNVGILEHAHGVATLDAAFSRIPALLCAAGPSLDHALPWIRDIAERALIVAVDTAVPALIEHGVEPDFAVVVDPQYWNTRHLDRLSPEATILISEASAHPRVFEVLESPTYLCSSIFPLGSILEQTIGEKGKLGTGGSVSTTAWDVARLLGADPIYCIGLDLGFPDRRTHVRGSFFEERSHLLAHRLHPAEQHSFEYLHDAEPFEVPANDGGTVLTDQRMMIYTWWFSNQSRIHADVRTRNLSPGGVAIEGVPAAGVEELLDRTPVRERITPHIEQLRASAATPGNARAAGLDRLAGKITDLADRLQDFADTARRGCSLVRELRHAEQPDFQRLDAVDAELGRFEYRDVAGFLMQEVADRVEDATRDRTVTGALESARLLYEGLVEAAEYHVRLLRRAPRYAQVSGFPVDN